MVKVLIHEGTEGTYTPEDVWVEHSEGLFIGFTDGHLKVTNGTGSHNVAIYAPGKWIRAEVVAEELTK